MFASHYQLRDYEKVFMLYAINGWTFAPRANWPAGAFPMRREVFEAIELHRRTLGLTAEVPRITKQWVKAETSQPAMLLYNVLLNRFYESIDTKRFNIVPVCHVKRHFIAIDTWSLFGILKEAGLASGSVDNFVATRDEQWRSVFKIEQLQGQHCTFAHSIETDGIALCVHFDRPLPALGSKVHADKFVVAEGDVVVGCDPGRVNIFFMVVPMPDGTFKTFVLTRRQYYSESGIHRAIKQSNAWNNGISDVLSVAAPPHVPRSGTTMSTVSTKGVNFNAFRDYVDAYRTHCDALWDEYLRPRWVAPSGRRWPQSGQHQATPVVVRRCRPKGVTGRYAARQEASLRSRFQQHEAASGRRLPWAADRHRLRICKVRARRSERGVCADEPSVQGVRFSVLHSRHTRVPVAASRPRASPGTTKVDFVNNTTLQKVAVIGSRYALRGVLWSVSRERFVSRVLAEGQVGGADTSTQRSTSDATSSSVWPQRGQWRPKGANQTSSTGRWLRE